MRGQKIIRQQKKRKELKIRTTKVSTLTARVHAAKYSTQLLGLNPASWSQLTTPLQYQN